MEKEKLLYLKERCFNKRVLYVEDDPYVRAQTYKFLELYFENITEASDGLWGIKEFKKSNFDLIFTDITMPNMDGLSFIKEVRKVNSTIPIIIFSAYDNTEYFIKTIELGVSGYILKPFTFQSIVTTLEKIVDHFDINEQKIVHLEDGYVWNIEKKSLTKNQKEIALSRYEIEFLNLLASSKNKIFSSEEIEIFVFYDNLSDNKRIRNLISRLRNKLGIKVVQNIYGEGYKLQWFQ